VIGRLTGRVRHTEDHAQSGIRAISSAACSFRLYEAPAKRQVCPYVAVGRIVLDAIGRALRHMLPAIAANSRVAALFRSDGAGPKDGNLRTLRRNGCPNSGQNRMKSDKALWLGAACALGSWPGRDARRLRLAASVSRLQTIGRPASRG